MNEMTSPGITWVRFDISKGFNAPADVFQAAMPEDLANAMPEAQGPLRAIFHRWQGRWQAIGAATTRAGARLVLERFLNLTPEQARAFGPYRAETANL